MLIERDMDIKSFYDPESGKLDCEKARDYLLPKMNELSQRMSERGLDVVNVTATLEDEDDTATTILWSALIYPGQIGAMTEMSLEGIRTLRDLVKKYEGQDLDSVSQAHHAEMLGDLKKRLQESVDAIGNAEEAIREGTPYDEAISEQFDKLRQQRIAEQEELEQQERLEKEDLDSWLKDGPEDDPETSF